MSCVGQRTDARRALNSNSGMKMPPAFLTSERAFPPGLSPHASRWTGPALRSQGCGATLWQQLARFGGFKPWPAVYRADEDVDLDMAMQSPCL